MRDRYHWTHGPTIRDWRCRNCDTPVGPAVLFCIDCARAFTLGGATAAGGAFLTLVAGWLLGKF